MNEITDLLLTGKARIQRGWAQVDWVAPNPAYGTPRVELKIGPGPRYDCAYTAIDTQDRTLFHSALNLLGFETVKEICVWNDQPGRIHKEVLALFDQAIDKSRNL